MWLLPEKVFNLLRLVEEMKSWKAGAVACTMAFISVGDRVRSILTDDIKQRSKEK